MITSMWAYIEEELTEVYCTIKLQNKKSKRNMERNQRVKHKALTEIDEYKVYSVEYIFS